MNYLESILLLQYEKALQILEECLCNFDDELWLDEEYQNPAWHIAYHVLYYTNIYLASSEEAVMHWQLEQGGLQYLSSSEHPEYSAAAKQADIYTREQLISFLGIIKRNLTGYLQKLHLNDPAWPPWYDETKGEFHLNNLRHLQHHPGELMERLNNRAQVFL